MPLTSPSRRTVAVLAASMVGSSTAVLGVTTASADVAGPPSWHVDASPADGIVSSDEVPDGICAIAWSVIGGQGGGVGGGAAGEIRTAMYVRPGDTFTIGAGSAGDAGGTAGVNTMGYNGGDASYAETIGGGGGAASVVVRDGDVNSYAFLAYGGNGVPGSEAAGGEGHENGNNHWTASAVKDERFDGATDDTEGSQRIGDGYVEGTGVLCAVPQAPQALSATPGDASATLTFLPPATRDGEDRILDSRGMPAAEPTGYEYTTDGGAKWADLPWTDGTDEDGWPLSGTVAGLTNGDLATIQIRATSVVGSGAESSFTVTPVAVTTPPAPAPAPAPQSSVAAPTGVTATPNSSSIKVAWTAPADKTGISGYQAFGTPVGDQSSARTVFCKPATANGTSCLLAATPGLAYGVGVTSLDATGAPVAFSALVTTEPVPAPPAPATLPKAEGTLALDDEDGTVTAGQQVIVTGKDLMPGSTVEIIVYSTPRRLGSALVAADGTFRQPVILPADLADGTHHLVASGIDVNGDPRFAITAITATGGSGGGEAHSLAATGAAIALPALGGLAALAAGGALLLTARRRTHG